jgi:hypothetical protein
LGVQRLDGRLLVVMDIGRMLVAGADETSAAGLSESPWRRLE